MSWVAFTWGPRMAKVWPHRMPAPSFFFIFHRVLHLLKMIMVTMADCVILAFCSLRTSFIIFNLLPSVPGLLTLQHNVTWMRICIFLPCTYHPKRQGKDEYERRWRTMAMQKGLLHERTQLWRHDWWRSAKGCERASPPKVICQPFERNCLNRKALMNLNEP